MSTPLKNWTLEAKIFPHENYIPIFFDPGLPRTDLRKDQELPAYRHQ